MKWKKKKTAFKRQGKERMTGVGWVVQAFATCGRAPACFSGKRRTKLLLPSGLAHKTFKIVAAKPYYTQQEGHGSHQKWGPLSGVQKRFGLWGIQKTKSLLKRIRCTFAKTEVWSCCKKRWKAYSSLCSSEWAFSTKNAYTSLDFPLSVVLHVSLKQCHIMVLINIIRYSILIPYRGTSLS